MRVYNQEVITLKKYQLLIGIFMGLLVPSVSVVAGYYRAMTSLDDKINSIQLQNVNTFARAQDVKAMSEKIDTIAVDVGEIKRYLRRSNK